MLYHIKNNRLSFIAIFILLLAAACKKEEKNAFSVDIALKNATPQKIYLQESPFGGAPPVVIDSVEIKPGKNDYTLKGMAKEEGIFWVVFENVPAIVLVNDATNIKLNVDLAKTGVDYYNFTGSKASTGIKDFLINYDQKISDAGATIKNIDSLYRIKAPDSLLNIAKAARDVAVKRVNDFAKQSISQSPSAALNVFVTGFARKSFSPEEMKENISILDKKFPEHSGVRSMVESYNKYIAARQQQTAPTSKLLGQAAPEISLPDVNGNTVSLNSLKGKFVLIDFWASWCGPCRQENPNVVRAFNLYKNKNFTILGVSLDDNKDRWVDAIGKDGLNWAQVSDLKGWQSVAAGAYGVRGIPANFLLDPTGKIIAENLRGADLEAKLAEVLK
jgi:peroxiredoxin